MMRTGTDMGERQRHRLKSVLKLAKRDEDSAVLDAATAQRRARDAVEDAEQTNRRLDELTPSSTVSASDFRRRQQRAALRADQAKLADEHLRELVREELEAREHLRGAIRRRRSLEELEGRRVATQAALAAQAAQRALDELAAMRRQSKEQHRDDR